MRDKYHQQLDKLRDRVVEMGQLARGMLVDGLESLFQLDRALAQKVLDQTAHLAELDFQIEEEGLQLVARQQPMARDLRFVAAALKLITYINRIGRYGKDIAGVTAHWPTVPHPTKLEELRRMMDTVQNMLDLVLTAYRTGVPFDVDRLKEWEQAVDASRWRVWHENVAYLMQHPQEIERGANYMMIARYLERCGDNVCKMAEKTHYALTGERITIR